MNCKGEINMNFIIIRSLCSILEASLWTYFIVSLIKILNKEEIKFTKKQIIIFIILLIVLFEIRLFYKKYTYFI